MTNEWAWDVFVCPAVNPLIGDDLAPLGTCRARVLFVRAKGLAWVFEKESRKLGRQRAVYFEGDVRFNEPFI